MHVVSAMFFPCSRSRFVYQRRKSVLLAVMVSCLQSRSDDISP